MCQLSTALEHRKFVKMSVYPAVVMRVNEFLNSLSIALEGLHSWVILPSAVPRHNILPTSTLNTILNYLNPSKHSTRYTMRLVPTLKRTYCKSSDENGCCNIRVRQMFLFSKESAFICLSYVNSYGLSNSCIYDQNTVNYHYPQQRMGTQLLNIQYKSSL